MAVRSYHHYTQTFCGDLTLIICAELLYSRISNSNIPPSPPAPIFTWLCIISLLGTSCNYYYYYYYMGGYCNEKRNTGLFIWKKENARVIAGVIY